MDTTLTQPLADSDTYKAQSSSNTVAQNADKLDEQTFIKQLLNNNRKRLQSFPDKQTAEEFIEELFRFLFVGEAQAIDEERLSEQYKSLKNTFAALLFEVVNDETTVKQNTTQFFSALPDIHQRLIKDAEAILASDPAARSIEEVMAAYPGFYATVVYRLTNQLWKQDVAFLPRFFSEYAHSKTGIDIHPAAEIGEHFCIDHGTGIVIGETCIIGDNVKLYQGVTLGALSVDKSMANTKRHPTVEDNVIIYSGATILGGETIIGNHSIIGGNVWLTKSIPPYSTVYHRPDIEVVEQINS